MRKLTLGKLLEEQAEQRGDREFVHFIDSGERLSYRTFNQRCNQFAHGLAAHGVRHGDFVGVMLRNSIENLICTYALKKLGVVEVSLNIDFRGRGLVRTVNLTDSPILITSDEFMQPLIQVADQLTHLQTLIVVGGSRTWLGDLEHIGFADLLSDNQRNPDGPTDDTELATVLFTSGTTGFSKGLQVSNRYLVCNAALVVDAYGLSEDDCVYTPWPLHHYGAAACEVAATLLSGGRIALRSRLSVSAYFEEVRATGATWAMMMGGLQKWLWDKEPGPQDRN